MTPTQHGWLLEDVREDLAAMIDDAENRGVTERAAREMIAIRDLVGWLEGGARRGSDSIGYLEGAIRSIPRNPGEGELAQRNVCHRRSRRGRGGCLPALAAPPRRPPLAGRVSREAVTTVIREPTTGRLGRGR